MTFLRTMVLSLSSLSGCRSLWRQHRPRVGAFLQDTFRSISCSLPKCRYAGSSSTPILTAMTPTATDDGTVYFRLHGRIPKDDFVKMRAIFREYKRKEMAKFDWEIQTWKMKESAFRSNPALTQTLRNRLRQARIHLRPLRGENKANGIEARRSTFEASVERILADGLQEVAITQQAGAFLILTPAHPPSDDRLGWWDLLFQDDTKSGPIDCILRNDLSGVTDLIEYQFDVPVIGSVTTSVYQTYDVWLVAEFTQLLSEKVSGVQVILSEGAQLAVEQRFTQRQERRKPIPEVEEIRHPEVPLHPHQIEGVRFFMKNNGRGLLGDEMGLGKTMTALAYMASTRKRALVVSPKKVLDHWASEAMSAFPGYFDGRILMLGSHIKRGTEDEAVVGLVKEARLVCVNYELVERFLPFVENSGLDTIVLDESHSIKNPQAKRTRLLLGVRDGFQHRLLLSGTPIKNQAEEFAAQLKFLGMDDADNIADMSPGKLWNTLQQTFLYLRRNIQVELPHLRFKDPEIVEANNFNGGMEVRMLDSKGRQSIRDVVMAGLYETALFKAPFSAALAQKLTDDFPKDKVIIVTERVSCAESIHEALQDEGLGDRTLLHHGKMPTAERASTLESCSDSKSEGPRILVSTRPSIGVGINLQCANRVIFNDLAWTPADILQAAARTKRLNQRKEVFEYWILSDARFDINLVLILQRKLNLMRLYGEGKNISEDDQKWMNERVTFEDIYYGI